MSESRVTGHRWHFQRIGGLDQVTLTSADDLCHLRELDPKLWVALSCPTSGLEFDQRILSLLDADGDGHIRMPEVVEATDWVCARLSNLEYLIHKPETLPLEVINERDADGQRLLATAHELLKQSGAPDRTYLTEEDVVQASHDAAQAAFNGDGIFPPAPALGEELRGFIQDALAVIGGVQDISTEAGINRDIAEVFVKALSNWQSWHNELKMATSVLEGNTPEAWNLMQELKDKIDDYFLRVDLASYAPQAEVALNVDEKSLVPTQNGLLEDAGLEALPLSKIEASTPLNLEHGLNPVWRTQVERFSQLVRPLLADPKVMTRTDWQKIQESLGSYAKAVASKPVPEIGGRVTIAATTLVEELGEERIKGILESNLLERFKAIVDQDLNTPVTATDIAALERLVIYHKYLYRLLMNFVSFHDFFDLEGTSAAFQVGELYIDGRRCDLCVPVKNIDQHMVLAGYTELFLLYCECTRKNQLGAEIEKKTIVAAMTLGRSDLLVEGRNGVFVDKQGQDWDAKVLKVVAKPISLREAIWAPYKRIGKLVTDQINKWASAKDSAVMQASAAKVDTVGAVAPPPADAPKFDIGRNVGIFAAIGLALGAIGTAAASIAKALFEMQWWQFPLLFLGIFLVISGPSWVLAWLKLRKRTLGPLLEASGWAVNGQVKINYALGGQLTSQAQLPLNAKRNLVDPLKDKKKTGLWIFLLALFIGSVVAGGAWRWYQQEMATEVPIAEVKEDTLVKEIVSNDVEGNGAKASAESEVVKEP